MSSYTFSKNIYKPYKTKKIHNRKNNTLKQSSIYNSIVCISNLYYDNNQEQTLPTNFM